MGHNTAKRCCSSPFTGFFLRRRRVCFTRLSWDVDLKDLASWGLKQNKPPPWGLRKNAQSYPRLSTQDLSQKDNPERSNFYKQLLKHVCEISCCIKSSFVNVNIFILPGRPKVIGLLPTKAWRCFSSSLSGRKAITNLLASFAYARRLSSSLYGGNTGMLLHTTAIVAFVMMNVQTSDCSLGAANRAARPKRHKNLII